MTTAFDAYSRDYEAVVQQSIAFAGLDYDVFVQAKVRLLAELFARHFGAARPALLDVGCGVGVMHGLLEALTGSLAGTDRSSEALARARREHPHVEYRSQSDGGLPWADAAFDVTLAVCVFHHVPPCERPALAAEMRRVTRRGGLTIIIEHNPLNPLTRLAVARCPFDHDAILLGAGESRTMLARAGLRRVHSQHFLVFPIANRLTSSIERRLRGVPLGAQFVAFGEA
jgi:SAM-dependent methyltransferase